MSRPLSLSDATGVIATAAGVGDLIVYGSSIPAPGIPGYMHGALLVHTGADFDEDIVKVNIGTDQAADFQSLSSLISIAASAGISTAYDAEEHIGLVAFSTDAASANTTKLNNALEAMKYDGDFDFATGASGPVLKPISFAGKTFYFTGTIKTNDRSGGMLVGANESQGVPYGTDEYGAGGSHGGMRTRFIRTDGASGPVIRLRGTGFTLRGIDFFGRPYTSNAGSGTKAVAGIQIEGGADSVGGRYRGAHTILGCTACECTYGIQVLAGYYNGSEVLQSDENHADLSYVRDFGAFNVSELFHCENEQAFCWTFDKILISNMGSGGGITSDAICFNMVKGGVIIANGVTLNHPSITLLSVQDSDSTSEYAYSNPSCEVRGLYWDAFPYPTYNSGNTYCTLFKYAGYHYGDLNFPQKYNVRISGTFGQNVSSYYDVTKLVDLGATPEEGVVIALELYADILNMPVTNFNRSGSGPWYRWNTSYSHRVQIVNGAITVRNNYHGVETESAAATDDLDTINGGGPGSILVLKAYDGTHDVVAKNGTGNLKLAGSDFTLNNANDSLTLVCDGTNWLELARSNNGS